MIELVGIHTRRSNQKFFIKWLLDVESNSLRSAISDHQVTVIVCEITSKLGGLFVFSWWSHPVGCIVMNRRFVACSQRSYLSPTTSQRVDHGVNWQDMSMAL